MKLESLGFKEAITLRKAAEGDLAVILAEIVSGVSTLWRSSVSDMLIVLRPEGNELVIVALVGRGLSPVLFEVADFAKVQGFRTIRFHTFRPQNLQKALKGWPVQIIDTPVIKGRMQTVYRYVIR